MSRDTILSFLLPDEHDQYLRALEKREIERMLEVLNSESPNDPAVLFPSITVREQGQCFIEGAVKYGGGFVVALGKAYLRADGVNSRKIRETWPEYWVKYVFFGKDIRESNSEES